MSFVMSIEQNLSQEKMFQHQSMPQYVLIKVCSQEFWSTSTLSDLNIRLGSGQFKSNAASKNWFKVARYDNSSTIFWIGEYEPVAMRLRQASMDKMDLIPTWCWNSLQPLGYFEWHWACQRTDSMLLYCCTLYIVLSWFKFCQWWSCADRVLTDALPDSAPAPACALNASAAPECSALCSANANANVLSLMRALVLDLLHSSGF